MIETLSVEKQRELNKLFLNVAENLDITETQFNNLTRSYNAVGKYLEEDPNFKDYQPVVTPQGSLRLGTIIQPITEDGDIDVDLVFRLIGKHPYWTQKHIKQMVGQRLKAHGTYCEMLDKEEGRRCWTLLYRQKSDNAQERYHMQTSNKLGTKLFQVLSWMTLQSGLLTIKLKIMIQAPLYLTG